MSVLDDCIDLAVEPRLDLEALAAARQFIGGDHPRAEAAGAIEVLAHAPLRGVALIFAHRAFHAAGVAGDAIDRVLERQMLGALADDDDHLAFIVELDRLLRPHQRLHMRRQRRQHAEEDRLEFRDVVALRAFLDVVEIIEAEADDLAGVRHRQREFQSGERAARRGRRFLGEIGERLRDRHCRGAASRRDRSGAFASAACRSMTLSPSTTPSRGPLSLRNRRFSWSTSLRHIRPRSARQGLAHFVERRPARKSGVRRRAASPREA